MADNNPQILSEHVKTGLEAQNKPSISACSDPKQMNRKGVQKAWVRKPAGYTTPTKTINKIKRLKAMNEPNTQIAIKTGVARGTVLKIVNDIQVKESIETIKSRLADKCAVIAETSLDAIGKDDINNASVVQKATVFGIAIDKYNDLTESNGADVGESNILNGLKDNDLKEYIKQGNTVRIGICIEPSTKPLHDAVDSK